jgi:hypothetical protein
MQDAHTTVEVPWQVAGRFWGRYEKGTLLDHKVKAQVVARKEKA